MLALRQRVLLLFAPTRFFEECERQDWTKDQFMNWIQTSHGMTKELNTFVRTHGTSDIHISLPEDQILPWFGSNVEFISMFNQNGKFYLTLKDMIQGNKPKAPWIKLLDISNDSVRSGVKIQPTTSTISKSIFFPTMTSVIVLHMDYLLTPELSYFNNYKQPEELSMFGWNTLPIHFFGLHVLFHFTSVASFGSKTDKNASYLSTIYTLPANLTLPCESDFFPTFEESQKRNRLFNCPERVRQYFTQIFEEKNYVIFIGLCFSIGVQYENKLQQ